MSPCEQLSGVEIKITTLVWEGRTNPEIAGFLGTSEQIVKNHLRCIFDKLGVWSRLELALYVAAHGGRCWADTFRHKRLRNNSPPLRENCSLTSFPG